jgi:hypothetical protein
LGREDQIAFELQAFMASDTTAIQRDPIDMWGKLLPDELNVAMDDALKKADTVQKRMVLWDTCARIPSQRYRLPLTLLTTPRQDVPLLWRQSLFQTILTRLPPSFLINMQMAKRKAQNVANLMNISFENILSKLWLLCLSYEPAYFNTVNIYQLLFAAWQSLGKSIVNAPFKISELPNNYEDFAQGFDRKNAWPPKPTSLEDALNWLDQPSK